LDLVGVVATILMVGLVVGFSYLARQASRSRGLEMALQAIMVLGGLLHALLALLALTISSYLSMGLALAGVLWTLLAFRGPSALLLRPLPADPRIPIHRFAVALAFGLMAINLSLAFSWSKVVGGVDVTEIRGLGSLWLLLVNDAGLVAVALAGVGWPEDRSLVAALKRLGIEAVSLWGLGLGLGVAAGLLAFGAALEAAAQAVGIAPDRASEVAMRQMLELAGRSPLRIAVIAVATGLSEEILFRGALQPRLGVVPTSLIFASFHVQYGVGLGFLEVVVAGLALGMLRDRLGTIPAALAHGAYNAGVLAILSLSAAAQG
jgi:membrane protease YdiL (CAAX protease family)